MDVQYHFPLPHPDAGGVSDATRSIELLNVVSTSKICRPIEEPRVIDTR